jgi:hypothetical protein
MLNPNLREIPDEVLTLAGQLILKCRHPVSQAYNLCYTVFYEGTDHVPTFTPKDLANKFGYKNVDKPLDCTNLNHYLLERERQMNLRYKMNLNSDGFMDRVFLFLLVPTTYGKDHSMQFLCMIQNMEQIDMD